jgi:hypothetical protein
MGDESSVGLFFFFIWTVPATAAATRAASSQIIFGEDYEASFQIVVFAFDGWRPRG